jgi:hypothetical protein
MPVRTHALDSMSGTDALRAAGYGHRQPPSGPNQWRRPHDQEIYRLSDGMVIGLMGAHEARVFAEQEWDAQRAKVRA